MEPLLVGTSGPRSRYLAEVGLGLRFCGEGGEEP